jgi:hypothetical protein
MPRVRGLVGGETQGSAEQGKTASVG